MDIDDFFDRIQKHFNDQLPFVTYRRPNDAKLKAFLQTDNTVHFISDYTESGFIFAPFDESEKSILIPESDSNFIETPFTKSNKNKNTPTASLVLEAKKELHISIVEKAIDKINKGELKKVVVSRKEEINLSVINAISIFQNLLSTYESAFVYCWYHPKIGLWLGATPETLVKTIGNRMSTMSLAGTQKYEGSLEVEWHSKEKEEQQIVTDYIVSNLKEAAKNIDVSEAKTVKAGNILHLKTDINAQLKSLNLKQIIQSLHPTPAICGFPKEQAKQFILRNEEYERQYYTGYLGELNIKEKTSRNPNRRNVENNAFGSISTVSNLYVNLRCMQLQNNIAIIYIGGGITKDSNPESEWEETVSKSDVIKSILSL